MQLLQGVDRSHIDRAGVLTAKSELRWKSLHIGGSG